MGDWIFGVIVGLLLLCQLLTCMFARRFFTRWMPFFAIVALTVLVIALYIATGGENWGYIILMFLLGLVLLADGVIILVNRLLRLIFGAIKNKLSA